MNDQYFIILDHAGSKMVENVICFDFLVSVLINLLKVSQTLLAANFLCFCFYKSIFCFSADSSIFF